MLLNPLMLWIGLGAVSVPILIHLLNKRKFEKVVWAAMRFLRISIEQNQRRIRVEDLLLLVVRCAILLLLGLALARPTLRSAAASGWMGRAKVAAVLLLDNSYSMTATDGAKSRFELAKDAAEQAIAALPAGSSVAVLLASDIVPSGPIPEPTYDLPLARRLVREAKVCDRGSNLFPALRHATELLRRRPAASREVYLITDGQSQAWKQFDDIRRGLEESRREVQTHVVLVGSALGRNLGISDVKLSGALAVVGQPLRFEVQVTNFGRDEERDVRVKLRVDAEAPSDETTIESIPAGASRTIALSAKLKTEGGHAVTASLEPDRLPADDMRTLAVRAVSQVRILLVDGEPAGGGRESEVFYLRHALLPVPRAEVEQHYDKVTVIASQELDSVRLDSYDVVFLCNVADLTERDAIAFADYLKRGGGLVIFPGELTRGRIYNELLGSRYQFLPAALGEARGDPSRDDQFQLLQDKNFEHPIATLWNDPSAGTLNVHFFRWIELLPVPAPINGADKPAAIEGVEIGAPRTVLRFADGKPAMVERTWGAGRVVLLASTADTAWNDLGARPNVFVPLVHRMLGAIISRQDEAMNVAVGQRFAWRADGKMIGREAIVAPPGVSMDDAAAVERSTIGMAGKAPLLTFDQTSLAGAYRVRLAGDEPVNLVFAAQPNPEESRLEELTDLQLKQIDALAGIVRWSGGGGLAQMLQRQRSGTELWKHLALAALVLAAAETILAHWFSKSK